MNINKLRRNYDKPSIVAIQLPKGLNLLGSVSLKSVPDEDIYLDDIEDQGEL